MELETVDTGLEPRVRMPVKSKVKSSPSQALVPKNTNQVPTIESKETGAYSKIL